MQGRIIDITTGISEKTPVYEGDPEPVIEQVFSIRDDGFAVSRISIGTHTGTHVDAPAHIYENGKSVDELGPDAFMGRALLLDLSCGKDPISCGELQKSYIQYANEDDLEVLLVRTRSSISGDGLSASGRLLDASAGKWIKDNGFRVLGVDTLSVDSDPSLPNHFLFLNSGISIVEYLHLVDADPGFYFFICLPLKIIGCDGAPARAILLKDPSL